jgi:RNA polymerase sigma-70 factor (ECF subfamily)
LTRQGNVVAAAHKFATKSELDLIRLVQAGDKQAYNRLYKQYIGKVYGLCFRLTGEKMLAEDAAQEVFIQLWRKIGNYQGDSKFSTWLHTVTSNITISYLRKQRGWLQRMFNIEDSVAMHEEAQASSAEVDLESYIVRLPERARIVFVLHAIEGYRHEEVAEMTNMAVGSSKAQFHRAKKLMKEWMGYA